MDKLNSTTWREDIIKNAELDKYDGKPKDDVSVIVGDDKSESFEAQVKLCRWSNECNFSVRLPKPALGSESLTEENGVITWEKANYKVEFLNYTEGEGGYKMVWFLKEKPLTNKIEFTIQSKGLDFFYQPPLTEEYQNGYSEEFQKEIVVTETQVKDLEGNVLAERPENVVGSYAVYHSTKGGMNDINGKEYKTGQAFFIYKSRLTDAEGKQSWAILRTENGIYSEEIPQKFLDTAVYPIKGNQTFGYTTAGESRLTISTNSFNGILQTSPADFGTVSKMSVYAKTWDETAGHQGYYKGLIVNHSDLTIVNNGISNESAQILTTTPTWFDATYTTAPTVSPSTDYVLGQVGKRQNASYAWVHYYNVGDADISHSENDNNYASPTNPSSIAHWTNLLSIYATYTPAGAGTAVKDIISGGIIPFAR